MSLSLAAGVVAAVARRLGRTLPVGTRLDGVAPTEDDAVDTAVATVVGAHGPGSDEAGALSAPALLGRCYEAALAPMVRSAGAHYTPGDLAARLVALVDLPGPGPRGGGPRVWDPACGGGAFLLAVADALLDAGHEPARVVTDLVWGTDIDSGAVAVAEVALCWWAGDHGCDGRPGENLAVLDALTGPPEGPLARAAGAGFDVVVGNPPFQGQLTGGSVRGDGERARLRERLGDDVVAAYTDTAALFLVTAVRSLAPGGRSVLVLPTSVLGARDAAGARRAVVEVAPLTGLWLATEAVFDASVEVCAVVCERARTDSGPSSPPVRRWRGRQVEPVVVGPGPGPGGVGSSVGVDGSASDWGGVALGVLGVPVPVWRSAGTIGDVAAVRAGFRDEYYGLVGHVGEAPDGPLPDHLAPLVTAGLIGPGTCHWGERPARFAKVSRWRPVVNLTSLAAAGGRAASWAATQQRPKVVVATQTRVGEAAVDEDGRWVASTPAVVLLADPGRLWELAAVVCSPVGTVAALAAGVGTARTLTALKHGVTSVSSLPLPVDDDAWRAGAAALGVRDRAGFADAMAAAYDLVDHRPLAHWWADRVPWD